MKSKILIAFVLGIRLFTLNEAQAHPWGHGLRQALQKSLLNEDQEALKTTLQILNANSSQHLERKVAEENLLVAFAQGKTLNKLPDPSKPYDKLNLVFSINRQMGAGQSGSIEFELNLTQLEYPDLIVIEREGHLIMKLTKKDLRSRYSENLTLLYGSSIYNLPLPDPGLYKLTLHFKGTPFTEWALVDEFPNPATWPKTHKVTQRKDGHFSIEISPLIQSEPSSKLKKKVVTVSESILGSTPSWFQMIEDGSNRTVVAPPFQESVIKQGIGISQFLKYQWGQIEVIQAINDWLEIPRVNK